MKEKSIFKAQPKNGQGQGLKGVKDNAQKQHAVLPKKLINLQKVDDMPPGIRVNMDYRDQQMDIFQSYSQFPIQLDHLNSENPEEAINLKKEKRKNQMMLRKQTLIGEYINKQSDHSPSPLSIIKKRPQKQEQSSDVQINLNNQAKVNRQVSIKEGDYKPKKKKERLQNKSPSEDSVKLKIKKGFSIVSANDFSLSSIDVQDQVLDQDQDSNSIISEEDSAFEDTPAMNHKNIKQKSMNWDQIKITPQGAKEERQLDEPKMNQEISGGNRGRTKPQDQQRLNYKRQRTQNVKKDEKAPIQRYISQGKEKEKFLNMPSQKLLTLDKSGSRLKQKQSIGGKHSRQSSYQFPESDHKYDHLSINFGKNNKFINTNKSKKNLNGKSNYDASVISVISSSKNVNQAVKGKLNKTNTRDSEYGIESTISGSYPKQKQKNNEQQKIKMVQIYLQTPYKINNQKDQNLYRAENNLTLHTVLRDTFEKVQWDKNKKIFTESYKESNAKDEGDLDYNTFTSLKKTAEMFKVNSTNRSNFIGVSSPITANNNKTIDQNVFSQKKQSAYEKEAKYKQQKLEQNFKKVFYEQLQNELDKKLETLKSHNAVLKKKSDLFSIYGPNPMQHTSSAFNSNKQRKEYSNKMNNILQNEDSPSQIQQMMNQSTTTVHVEETQQFTKYNNKSLQKINPYLPLNVKNKRRAIQQIQNNKQFSPAPKQMKAAYVKQQYRPTQSDYSDNENIDVSVSKMMEDRQNFIQNVSLTMGFNKLQIQDLQQRHNKLRQQERSLERYVRQDKTLIGTFGIQVDNNYNSQADMDYYDHVEQDSAKYVNASQKSDKFDEQFLSPEINEKVEDYFTNKTDLRRSIDNQAYKEGKKLKNASYQYQLSPKSKTKNNNYISHNKNQISSGQKTVLPEIIKSQKSKQIFSENDPFNSPDKMQQQSQISLSLSNNKYQPLKKSNTYKDREKNIRQQKDNVIMAYSVPASNINAQNNQQLAYQFKNQSPQNQRDVEQIQLQPQAKIIGNTFATNKTSVLLKGCLNQKQWMNKLLTNPGPARKLKINNNKASINTLPQIIQTIENAPGQ